MDQTNTKQTTEINVSFHIERYSSQGLSVPEGFKLGIYNIITLTKHSW